MRFFNIISFLNDHKNAGQIPEFYFSSTKDFRIALVARTSVLITCVFLNHTSQAYVEEVVPGSHYTHHTFYEANSEAFAACKIFSQEYRVNRSPGAPLFGCNYSTYSNFNLPIKITEPSRETTYTCDASGNELSRTVTEIS